MAKKKSGYSKKTKDWLGNTVIKHFNSRGENTGQSKFTKNIWGKQRTERYNSKGEKTGYSKDAKTFFGNSIKERFNAKGEKIGHNKKSETFWGVPITERFNARGEKTGFSKKARTFWNTPITEHYSETAAHPFRDSNAASSPSSAADSGTSGAGSSSSGWVLGAVLLLVLVVAMGQLSSLQDWVADLLVPPTGIRQENQTFATDRRSGPSPFLPVDEASEDSSFAEFREDLLSAISRKDSGFLLRVLAPDIKVGFGDNPDNPTEFARMWNIESPDSAIWPELGKVLNMGGVFSIEKGERVFCAPYVTGAWPQNLDPFGYMAVIAKDVEVRRSPDATSPSLGALSYSVVHFTNWTKDRLWGRVTMQDGTTGFVSREYLRSPVDYRAFFKQVNGRWALTAFVSGD